MPHRRMFVVECRSVEVKDFDTSIRAVPDIVEFPVNVGDAQPLEMTLGVLQTGNIRRINTFCGLQKLHIHGGIPNTVYLNDVGMWVFQDELRNLSFQRPWILFAEKGATFERFTEPMYFSVVAKTPGGGLHL